MGETKLQLAAATEKPIKFDSRIEARAHIAAVYRNIWEFINTMKHRAVVHDGSKYSDVEHKLRDKVIPRLRKTAYGSPEYDALLEEMRPAIEHHHKHNSHHPEHYKDGIAGMTLFDLVEMFCDWKAAAERDGYAFDPSKALERYGVEPQLAAIIRNTQDRWMAW